MNFGSKGPPGDPNIPSLTVWESIYAQLADDIKPVSVCNTATVPAAAPQKTAHGTGWAKSLSLRLTKEAATQKNLVKVSQTVVVDPVITTTQASVPPDPFTVTELCQIIPEASVVGRYGVITDAERNFELRPPENPPK